MMANSPRLVQWSVRLYEKLILAYPVEFRKKFASEMTLVFRELASDAHRQYGIFGLFWAWCRVLGDLLWTVLQEHGSAFSRSIFMKTTIRTFLWSIFAAFIHYFVFLSMGFLFMGLIFLFHRESWLMRSDRGNGFSFLEYALFIIAPFVTGMILARTKPFFRPHLTAPLAIMMIGGLILCFGAVPDPPFASSIWGYVAFYCLGLVAVAFFGLETLLGCIVATKLSERLSKPRTVHQVSNRLI
jgi:hypothetical protein